MTGNAFVEPGLYARFLRQRSLYRVGVCKFNQTILTAKVL